MAQDPYSVCPCGSGKKLKFCCASVFNEMEKIARLQKNHQNKTALQTLQSLQETHPDAPWVPICRTEILIQERRYEEALRLMAEFSKQYPDHGLGQVLLAIVHLFARGYDQAKRTIHRCFQKCSKTHPEAISQIADGIASMMYANDSFLSARQHLALAIRYAPPQQRNNLFMKMAGLESNDSIPYPLRSVHQLLPYDSEDSERQKEGLRAAKLSAIGCWDPAGILFRRLTEQDTGNAVLHYNLGLCLAWDGNEVEAATSLHRAAELFSDDDVAIEAETLAQLLDLETTADVTRFVAQRYTFESTSQVLTQLDADKRLSRIKIDEGDEDYQAQEKPVALYRHTSREITDEEDTSNWSLADVPLTIAEIAVFDQNADNPPHLQISGGSCDDYESAIESLNSTLENLLTPINPEESLELGVVPNEMMPLAWSWHFPRKTPDVLRRKLEAEKLRTVTLTEWPDRSLPSLGNKSPREMASNDSGRRQLRAAVHVLDAWCDRHSQFLDRTALCKELGLPQAERIEPDDSTSVVSMSAMQLQRIAIEKLTDEQLLEIVNRALLIRQSDLTQRVLSEVVTRPECLEKVGELRVYTGLFRCCSEQSRREEALKWIDSARNSPPQQKSEFEHKLEWDLRELSFRLEDPSDEKLPELVQRIQREYGNKLPEMNEIMAESLSVVGLQHLMSDTVVPAPAGVWTPDGSTGDSSQGEKKLWVPGQ